MTYSVVGEYLSLPQVLLWLNLPHHALCVSTTYKKTKMRKQFTVSHSNTSFFAFSFQNFIYILTSFDNHFFLGQKKLRSLGWTISSSSALPATRVTFFWPYKRSCFLWKEVGLILVNRTSVTITLTLSPL